MLIEHLAETSEEFLDSTAPEKTGVDEPSFQINMADKVTVDKATREQTSLAESQADSASLDDATTTGKTAATRFTKALNSESSTWKLGNEYKNVNLDRIHIFHHQNPCEEMDKLLNSIGGSIIKAPLGVTTLFQWWNLSVPGGGVTNTSMNLSGSSASVKYDAFQGGGSLYSSIVQSTHQRLKNYARLAPQLFGAFDLFIKTVAEKLYKSLHPEPDVPPLQFCYRISTMVTQKYNPQPPNREAYPGDELGHVFILLFPMQDTGAFYSIWPRQKSPDAIVEGEIGWCPFGQVLLLPSKTVKAEGYLADPKGHFRGHCALILGTDTYPGDVGKKRTLTLTYLSQVVMFLLTQN
jgi:hypothetical protein